MAKPLVTKAVIQIGNERRKTIRAIKRLVEPHFRDSNYRCRIDYNKPRFSEGNSRPVRMWSPGRGSDVTLRGAFKLTSFLAITEFGPMVDASGGGMVWESYSEFPLEDLLKLRAWAERTLLAPAEAA